MGSIFLGRFPNAAETTYWIDQLDNQGLTTAQVIGYFAVTPEFDIILSEYFGLLFIIDDEG